MAKVMKDLWLDDKANRVSSGFASRHKSVLKQFFSRDPKRWPIYQIPEISDMVNRRLSRHARSNVSMSERLERESRLSLTGSNEPSAFESLALFAANMAKNWEDPASVENVVSTPCDPAIHGALLATIANPNLISSEYAGEAAELEKVMIRQIANLIGYDDKQATGLFTQGGTFCNLYGYLLGIRKTFPSSAVNGFADESFCMMNSEAGHYSNMTDLALLGVNINKQVVRVRINKNNQLDLAAFERELETCIRNKVKVPTILLTCGTTDTFAIDDVAEVYRIRELMVRRYRLDYRPHIHVDSAVGWSLIFFNGYDFRNNPLGINPATLSGLESLMPLVAGLKYADSVTIDFQKWGYVPYTSSLIMIKNRQDMLALKQNPDYFSYFEPRIKEQSHLQSTIECSRSAVGVFSAYNALMKIGVDGYRVLIAHGLQNANYLRYLLSREKHCKVVCADNQGPSVTFRLYHQNTTEDPQVLFNQERCLHSDDDFLNRMASHAAYHRNNFLSRRGRYLMTNWVDSIARTHYDKCGHCLYLPGEKAVFFNPHTSRQQIEEFVAHLYHRRE
jgi:glutamate/tyrosine decarboxylase-like PLP-dependent enzyme